MSETPIGDQAEQETLGATELGLNNADEAPPVDPLTEAAETIAMTDPYRIPGEETSGEAEVIDPEDQGDPEDTTEAAEDEPGQDPPVAEPAEG